MATQINLFENTVYDFLSCDNNCKKKKKRNRAIYPSYMKVYTVNAFDITKYKELFEPIIKQAQEEENPSIYWNTNPYDLLNKCYLKDKHGFYKRLEDAPHIFRYKTLYKIYKELGTEIIKGGINEQMKLEINNV